MKITASLSIICDLSISYSWRTISTSFSYALTFLLKSFISSAESKVWLFVFWFVASLHIFIKWFYRRICRSWMTSTLSIFLIFSYSWRTFSELLQLLMCLLQVFTFMKRLVMELCNSSLSTRIGVVLKTDELKLFYDVSILSVIFYIGGILL